NENYYRVLETLRPEDFYLHAHRVIFGQMVELIERARAVDLITIQDELVRVSQLESAGGIVYLASLLDGMPHLVNIEHYIEIIKEKSLFRQLVNCANKIMAECFDQADPAEHVLDRAEQSLFGLSEKRVKSGFIAVKDLELPATRLLEKLYNEREMITGVPSGFRDLDRMTSGLQPSDLIILAARPSMGKTALALDIARHAATQHNVTVGMFSLEMSAQQLVDRMVAAEAKVNSWNLRTGRISEGDDFTKIRDAYDRLSRAPIYIDDKPGNNILAMRSVCRRLKREHGLGLIIVDYLQLMVPTQSRNSDNIVQQVTEISRSLKNLARELDVPVMALSQLSRAVEQRGGKPRLSDLRDSGSIEQDADVVMFIHRDDKINKEASDRPNIAEILIEKHRNGPVGKIDLFYDDKRTTFVSLEKSDFGVFEAAAQDF
ncbi:MAG TPA: replicative DNA helicase, partial [Candidatus Paceibacterota bacterium]|nr:replicative DNA helicase [Candidatus Paceibacterota bacterium]